MDDAAKSCIVKLGMKSHKFSVCSSSISLKKIADQTSLLYPAASSESALHRDAPRIFLHLIENNLSFSSDF